MYNVLNVYAQLRLKNEYSYIVVVAYAKLWFILQNFTDIVRTGKLEFITLYNVHVQQFGSTTHCSLP